jgi:hypothetical protein
MLDPDRSEAGLAHPCGTVGTGVVETAGSLDQQVQAHQQAESVLPRSSSLKASLTRMAPQARFWGAGYICLDAVMDEKAVFGQLTVLRKPEITASAADSATHANRKVGCRAFLRLTPRE